MTILVVDLEGGVPRDLLGETVPVGPGKADSCDLVGIFIKISFGDAQISLPTS